MIELRSSNRYPVKLACRLETEAHSLNAEVRDLSASGARIVLQISGGLQDIWKLRSVRIETLGWFQADVRWTSGDVVGVAFARPEARIQDYLSALRIEPLEMPTIGYIAGHAALT